MNTRFQSHFFWGKYAPLSSLTGAALLIMASARLAHAILCAAGILWVYCVTALIFFSAKKIIPKKGNHVILLFLSSFAGSIFILFMSLLNPLLTEGTWFFLVLIPPFCIGSGAFLESGPMETGEVLFHLGLEGACMGLLVIAVSLIREPLGLGSLSLPGGPWGIVELFGRPEEGGGLIPLRILSVSAGGFLILGFAVGIFRYFQSKNSGTEDNS